MNISSLLKSEEERSRPTASIPVSSRSALAPRTAAASTTADSKPLSATETVPSKRQPSKWSQEEDEKIVQLRGEAMKWEDISKQLPGRSATSCRLHYQNYLERKSEWDEGRKNKLAMLYERFKHQMWVPVAEEMSIPWRAVEAMHWKLGGQEMAQRAGVTPFHLTSESHTAAPSSQTRSNAMTEMW